MLDQILVDKEVEVFQPSKICDLKINLDKKMIKLRLFYQHYFNLVKNLSAI